MQQFYIKELEFTALKEDHDITQETISNMDAIELKVLVKGMHRKGDSIIPTSKEELRKIWNEAKDRNNILCKVYLILLGYEEGDVKDLTIYPTADELTAERRITLENDRQATMARKAASQEKSQAHSKKLKDRYNKEIQQHIKEKGKYQLAVQSLPQQDDTDAWKKVTMATLKTLVK